jgi:predicted GNAT superfamily acetyltransferase
MATQPRDHRTGDPAASEPAVAARSAAIAAARRAGVHVRELVTTTELVAAADLAARVWKTDDTSQMDASLMRALSHSGNFVAGAFLADDSGEEGALVGMSVGFAATRPAASLHSHMTCTADEHRDRGLGYALKVYQRSWAVQRGFTTVTWTFDPLVRRNAYFNLAKLGAQIVEYLPNHYGTMMDGLNASDESDRLFLAWPITDPDRPARSRLPEPTEHTVVLEVAADGGPHCLDDDVDRIACQVPDDIVALREQDPRSAARWRRALRETLADALTDGYQVDGFTRSGHYLLSRDRRAAAAGGG